MSLDKLKELEAELGELRPAVSLLRAANADLRAECERLRGDLLQVAQHRDRLECERHGKMHVPRVHLETVASLLGRAADELEPWRTDRDGVVGLMVRATVDHLELLLEAE